MLVCNIVNPYRFVAVSAATSAFDPLTYDAHVIELWDGDTAVTGSDWVGSKNSYALVPISGPHVSASVAGLNGHTLIQTMKWGGSDITGSHLQTPSGAAFVPSESGHTQYYVLYKRTHLGNRYVFDSGWGTTLFPVSRQANPQYNNYAHGSSGFGNMTPTASVDTFFIWTIGSIVGSNTTYQRRDSYMALTASISSANWNNGASGSLRGLTFGASRTAGAFTFSGMGVAYIIFRDQIDPPDVQELYIDYLKTRFGITCTGSYG